MDTDSLPDYPVLDAILALYVDRDRGADEIVAAGFDAALVTKTLRMVDRAEYKRRQYPPGTKISPRASARTAASRSRTTGAKAHASDARRPPPVGGSGPRRGGRPRTGATAPAGTAAGVDAPAAAGGHPAPSPSTAGGHRCAFPFSRGQSRLLQCLKGLGGVPSGTGGRWGYLPLRGPPLKRSREWEAPRQRGLRVPARGTRRLSPP
ncbi:hypothetical protein SHKM778_73370 [Streptomyces sp. KM77-8]|uniref:NAD/GMP synthase domain-containing protein n=1 Tax=Streptomyces haneummycinicus TaxID=3074435 RepID=A0AAT9HUY3_9ACTN